MYTEINFRIFQLPARLGTLFLIALGYGLV